jgi:hypothetical protein
MEKQNLQDLIFLLEYKLHQSRSDIMEAPFWEIRMRAKQYQKYMEEKSKAMAEASSKIKKPTSSNFRVPTRGFK